MGVLYFLVNNEGVFIKALISYNLNLFFSLNFPTIKKKVGIEPYITDKKLKCQVLNV